MSPPLLPTHESYLVIGGGTSLGELIVEQLLRRGRNSPLIAEQTARFGNNVSVYVGDILVPESIADAVKSLSTTEARYFASYSPSQTPDGEKNKLNELMAIHKKTLSSLPNAGTSGHEAQSHAERMVLSFNGLNELANSGNPAGHGFRSRVRPGLLLLKIRTQPGIVGLQIGENPNLIDMTFVANAAHALFSPRTVSRQPTRSTAPPPARRSSSPTAPRAPIWDFPRSLWAAAGGPGAVPTIIGKAWHESFSVMYRLYLMMKEYGGQRSVVMPDLNIFAAGHFYLFVPMSLLLDELPKLESSLSWKEQRFQELQFSFKM
ncbi:hypothetical protein C8F04DRAFT_1203250, partial [Mycena alexandri]